MTADLFADGHGGTHEGTGTAAVGTAVGPAEAPPRGTAHAIVRSVPPPLPHAGARPRTKQLWYAVVFPELMGSQRPAHRVESMLQRLCLAAQQFTSLVSIEMPNALLLEIKGSVKLFGSLAVLQASIDAAWGRLSLRAHSATAPTTLAALWFARAGKQVCIEDPAVLAGALADLPIACTSWDAERLQTLRSMGVTRVGELLRLPRAGVARRLSPAAVLDLDIALARLAAPRRAFVARERFRERCDFETEIETAVYLQKALEPLTERCAQFLRERQAGIQALELRLRHRVIPVTRVRLGLASITSERRRLADVLDEKLNRLELAAPVRGMELLSGSLQPLSADSLDAFAGLRGGGRDVRVGDAAPQLVERLRARLGEEAVYGVVSVAEHRPEAAWQRVYELRLASTVRAPGVRVPDVHVSDMPRPVWLLKEPALLSADLQQLRQEGVLLEQGPERIESGWWDGKGVARDYYIARQIHGARWWVFQERQTKSWYLHGLFA
ncbi:MAG TPA: DNA polymerase Y family protein [Steroidobacteraceae bacterium]|nr:DNA polymerase Y family protein [Steroidobacteraceae bacterium]